MQEGGNRDIDDWRSPEDERHHVERKAARLERPDDAGRSHSAQRAGKGGSGEPPRREARQRPLRAESDNRDDDAGRNEIPV